MSKTFSPITVTNTYEVPDFWSLSQQDAVDFVRLFREEIINNLAMVGPISEDPYKYGNGAGKNLWYERIVKHEYMSYEIDYLLDVHAAYEHTGLVLDAHDAEHAMNQKAEWLYSNMCLAWIDGIVRKLNAIDRKSGLQAIAAAFDAVLAEAEPKGEAERWTASDIYDGDTTHYALTVTCSFRLDNELRAIRAADGTIVGFKTPDGREVKPFVGLEVQTSDDERGDSIDYLHTTTDIEAVGFFCQQYNGSEFNTPDPDAADLPDAE